jgi:uncharacterized protein
MNNWKSVIAYGTYEELDKNEANKGLDILMDNVMSTLEKKLHRVEAKQMRVSVN